MSSSHGLELVEKISATHENAVAIQRLTLQDLEAGGFPNPRETADPTNETLVKNQLDKLTKHPERYSGYLLDGELVAYIKHAEWLVEFEVRFVPSLEGARMWVRRLVTSVTDTGEWGVLGLVVDEALDEGQREEVLTGLLKSTLTDSKGVSRTVNVPIHDHDPLLDIALSLGFVRKGERGEMPGAPGIKQWRYQRSEFI